MQLTRLVGTRRLCTMSSSPAQQSVRKPANTHYVLMCPPHGRFYIFARSWYALYLIAAAAMALAKVNSF
jgi:polyphosphate kinase 2 (PPK2 family)